jgi:large subunit ribosomal protein L13
MRTYTFCAFVLNIIWKYGLENMKSFVPKESEIQREWLVVDAAGVPAGRLAVFIADRLRGKHKPTFTPHVDTGAFIVVINCEKVKLSGAKEDKKIYQDYSGYSSGLKERKASVIRASHPERIITQAVRGMLPKNRLARGMMTRLKVHTGATHPYAAQQPTVVEFKG